MSMVWESFPASGSELLAMLAMADWANDAGGSLHPSMRAIAEKVRVSEKQARRIVQGLVADGFLMVVGNALGGRPGDTKQWVINVKKLKEFAEKKEAETASTPPTHGSPTPPADGSRTPPTHGSPPLPPMGAVPLPPVSQTPPTGGSLTTIEPPIYGIHKYNAPVVRPSDVTEQVWSDFLALRKERRSKLTETALVGIRSAADKAGFTLQAALELCCERGWQSFRADWVVPAQPGKAVKPGLSKTDELRERNRRNANQWLNESGGESHASV